MATSRKISLWYKVIALFLMLVLIVPVLVACDDDDDDGKSTTAAATTPIATTPATATPTAPTPTETVSTEPVKMGIVTALSGPMAMAGMMNKQVVDVAQKLLEQRGGIKVGDVHRSAEILWYDDEAQVSGTQAGWTKLVNQDHISVMIGGPTTGATDIEMCNQSGVFKVPFVFYAGTESSLDEYPYTTRCGFNLRTAVLPVIDFLLDMEPRTVALLGDEESADHTYFDMLKEKALEPLGAEIVYEEYMPLGTTDIAPYLTKIKYENPDLLVHFTASYTVAAATFKQIAELGGWGRMKCLAPMPPQSNYMTMPAAEGTYLWTQWVPKMDNPGTREFLQAWDQYGKGAVDPNHIYFWNAFWTAVHAIELAGSDEPEEINKALRSGNLSWEAPTGLMQIGTDGEPGIRGVLLKVGKDGDYTIAYR